MDEYLCPKCGAVGVRSGRNAHCTVCQKAIAGARYRSPEAKAKRTEAVRARDADPARRGAYLAGKKRHSEKRRVVVRLAIRKWVRARAAKREEARPFNPRAKVYFVQDTERGLIKVGFTTKEMRGRLKELQCGNPFPIAVLALVQGTRLDEKLLHDRFEILRFRGEWFHPAPELLDYIASLSPIARAA